MATFSKSSFNATKYAASRPHYPPALYSHVLDYAARTSDGSPSTVVDVGCGPGLSTFAFSSHFDRIIGVDPSDNMVKAARSILQARHVEDAAKFRFERAKVDELEFIESRSVDLVVAGQAAHWFDPLPTFASLARVLKPGGTFCFWGYGEIFFPRRPELSALIPPYSGELLGPYWEQPGRSIVENLLVPFPLPIPSNFAASTTSRTDVDTICSAFDFDSLQRTFHLDASSPSPPELLKAERASNIQTCQHPLLLTKTWTLEGLEGYLRTWSSLHKYEEEHGSEPDVVRELLGKMRDNGWKDGEEVVASWQVGMVMGKKKKATS